MLTRRYNAGLIGPKKARGKVPDNALKHRGNMDYDQMSRATLIRMLQEQEEAARDAGKDGIVMNYMGRAAPWQITRLVKPKLSKIIEKHSFGEESHQSSNEIWDGENLSTMVTLYKHRGRVDLILTDPPYNTGEDFRYNDKWDKDPNDPDLGDLVPKDDGSRHSKWLKFMTPRLWMMREMLKPGGVIAICIDHRELYRLGMLMDEIFKEENRIGIINWQKSYSPRSDNKGLSTATEYVLVYAKSAERSKTRLTERTEAMDSRYVGNADSDAHEWKSGDASGPNAATHRKMVYGIQSPFTGAIYYPPEGRCWANEKKNMKQWLEAWGHEYQEKWIDDGNIIGDGDCGVKVKALVIKGLSFKAGVPTGGKNILADASRKAYDRMAEGSWPALYFGLKGETGPQLKRYLKDVKKGKVPMTYWADEDYEKPLNIESQSWDHEESGHSQLGVTELDDVVGKGHGFKTVKPLRLIKKIIQIWCRPDGLVLDPFAGSGTTAHAVLELNAESGADRNFILIEQGNTEKGDHYASSLTAERVRRVLSGDWAAGKRPPLKGGFRYLELKREKIDAEALNALAREEMIDLLLTVSWNKAEKAKSYLQRLPAGTHRHLFAKNSKNEGFFLIWETSGKLSSLTRSVFKEVVEEAKQAALAPRYHVYASLAPYTGSGIEFYKIPDSVLEHIGFNPRSDAYNNEIAEETADA